MTRIADRIHPGAVLNDVLVGRESQLFLASGGHHILEVATGARRVPKEVVSIFRDNVLRRHARIAPHARYLHVIFPDKQSVMSRQYVVTDPVRLGEMFLRDAPDVAKLVLYPLALLRAEDERAFMRTDTHLTDRGTITVVCEIVARVSGVDQSAARQALLDRLTVTRAHCGDLGSKLSPRASSEEVFAEISWKHLWLHNSMVGGNNGMVDIYLNHEAPDPSRLLMYGDSFGREACKFLSAMFAQVIFLRTPFFHPDLFEAIQPDIVVTENVERYLDSCRPDEARPSFFMYPHLAGNPYQPSPEFARAFSAMLSYGRPAYEEFIKSPAAQRR